MYNALKTDLAALLGISKDALHIHVGLAIFVALLLIMRRSPMSLLPWLGVVAFEAVNEFLDIFHWYGGQFYFEVGDSVKDAINTLFWPTVVTLAMRAGAGRKAKDGG